MVETEDFLATLPPLKSLSLNGYTGWLDLKLALGQSRSVLQRLESREWESSRASEPRPVFIIERLKELNNVCPEIRELSIDINRDVTWPLDTFDALSAFENLEHLKVNLELGNDLHKGESSDYMPRRLRRVSEEDYRQPVFNAESGKKLFKYLRERKNWKALERMTVTIGDWGRDFGGGLRITGWGEGLEKKWICKETEETDECVKVDDGVCRGMIGWDDG